MCGIYGKLSSHQIDASSVETATDRLVHAVPTSGRTALQLAQCKNDRELSAAKRVFDVSAAAAELVILAPLFAAFLGPVLKLFVVRMPGGEVISGGLFTLCDGIVQYHLGGTRNTALKLSPTVLIFEIVRHWPHENGAHTFRPGGGFGGKTDSLFQFKAHFSRRRHEFVTWRWIVAPETYRELSRQKQLSDSERGLRAISPSFFPAYRCPSEPDTVPAGLRAPAPAMAAPDEIQVAQNG
jgi:hypothetical protein